MVSHGLAGAETLVRGHPTFWVLKFTSNGEDAQNDNNWQSLWAWVSKWWNNHAVKMEADAFSEFAAAGLRKQELRTQDQYPVYRILQGYYRILQGYYRILQGSTMRKQAEHGWSLVKPLLLVWHAERWPSPLCRKRSPGDPWLSKWHAWSKSGWG